MSFVPQDPPSRDTDAYHLGDAETFGVDAYAGHWVVESRGEAFPASVDRLREQGAKSVWWKRLDRRRKEAPVWVEGEAVASPFRVREHGVAYEVDLEAGYSQGLFLDQRLNRLAVRERVTSGERVLNTFAYTCSFSVVAALAGAVTTSLDLSKSYLEWGKRNFEANGLAADGHFFPRGDVLDWLGRWKKSGVRFDGIVLDPPTFSRGGSRGVFRVEKDYGDLVATARELLRPGGWMLCSTNVRRMKEAEFERMVRGVLAGLGRCELRGMPPEYTGERYLKSVWVEFG